MLNKKIIFGFLGGIVLGNIAYRVNKNMNKKDIFIEEPTNDLVNETRDDLDYLIDEYLKEETDDELDTVMEEIDNELLEDEASKWSNDIINDINSPVEHEYPYYINNDDLGELDNYDVAEIFVHQDGVITDDMGIEIDDIVGTIGDPSIYMPLLSSTDKEVCMRNDRLKCDYEISLSTYNSDVYRKIHQ